MTSTSEKAMFRRAEPGDLEAIAGIYGRVHDAEEAGEAVIGWDRRVYPTRETARQAIAAGEMFVLEEGGRVVASGRINREQVDVYAGGSWEFPAPDDRVMVLHTLTVDPQTAHRGFGRAFVAAYERYALAHGCPFLRIDTNERNTRARAFYAAQGYREAGIVPCTFNGIPGVRLVLLEKKL